MEEIMIEDYEVEVENAMNKINNEQSRDTNR